MKKLLFIVNPRAGRTRSRTPLYDALAQFSQAGYLIHIFQTQTRGDATRAACQLGPDFDLVVCVGGDGTLNEIVNGLMQLSQRPPLGYLPHGSTNDFAASLRLNADPAKAAARIVSGQSMSLDIGRHNDRYFSYVASFGAFTRSSWSVSQDAKNLLGHTAYLLGGIKDLDTLRPYRCRVEADGDVFEGEFIFGAVCNSTSLGGLVKLDPALVCMDDGLFELLLLPMPKTPIDLQNLLMALNKPQETSPGIIFRHVRQVTVTTEDDLPWSLDGEYSPSTPKSTITVLPGAIELIL